eukprot:TRINITY_DN4728_c0_g1_i2.p1 TRINITY_DN4728_c0_g1~~TRINITY_DN4728_c0_g1_i2.p1  ORF type:complete len:403 (+),score=58.55 TRINITY_DN4728_c0_g1_i2:26-1234(+)
MNPPFGANDNLNINNIIPTLPNPTSNVLPMPSLPATQFNRIGPPIRTNPQTGTPYLDPVYQLNSQLNRGNFTSMPKQSFTRPTQPLLTSQIAGQYQSTGTLPGLPQLRGGINASMYGGMPVSRPTINSTTNILQSNSAISNPKVVMPSTSISTQPQQSLQLSQQQINQESTTSEEDPKQYTDISLLAGLDLEQEEASILPQLKSIGSQLPQRLEYHDFIDSDVVSARLKNTASKYRLSIGAKTSDYLMLALLEKLRDLMESLVTVADQRVDDSRKIYPIVVSSDIRQYVKEITKDPVLATTSNLSQDIQYTVDFPQPTLNRLHELNRQKSQEGSLEPQLESELQELEAIWELAVEQAQRMPSVGVINKRDLLFLGLYDRFYPKTKAYQEHVWASPMGGDVNI